MNAVCRVVFPALLLATLAWGTCVASPDLTAPVTDRVFAEQGLFRALNADRTAQGLAPLTLNHALTNAARKHSEEMAELDYVDHISPVAELRTPMKRFAKELGYQRPNVTLGEDVYYSNSYSGPEKIRAALMRNEPHRAIIMRADAREVGIGLFTAGDGRVWVTVMALSPA